MDGFYVLGYIDTNTKPEGETPFVKDIVDYKTGDIIKKTPDYDSDDYEQLDIYAAALYQEFGKLPESAKVVLVGRAGNAFKGEELTLTKESAIIEKVLSEERMDRVKKGIQETAEEISLLYRTFLKLKGE